LKCDGTPRQTCSDTNAVSSTQAAVNAPSNIVLVRSRNRRNDVTHAMAIDVKPNESPNVIALRSESGPSHDAPLPSRRAIWITPLAINSAPAA